MTRTLMAVVAALTVAALVVIVGCGKARETVDAARNAGEAAKLAKSGKATFHTEKGDVQVESKQGKNEGESETKITQADGKTLTAQTGKTIDAAKLGLEPYPGATVENSITAGSAEGGVTTAELVTTDPFDKVAKFYKDKYTAVHSQEGSGDDGKTLMMQMGNGMDLKMVMVSQDKKTGKTKILLQHHAQKQ